MEGDSHILKKPHTRKSAFVSTCWPLCLQDNDEREGTYSVAG